MHDWLRENRPHYVIDINRDTQLQDSYAEQPHNLIVGMARLGGRDFRYQLYVRDGAVYRKVEASDPALPILFKPMGRPTPVPTYIASDADHVDYITELMGGFAIPAVKELLLGKRYLLMGLRLNRDTDRMAMPSTSSLAGRSRRGRWSRRSRAGGRFSARIAATFWEKNMSDDLGRVIRNGLGDQNVVFSQMLALCPAMAVTTSSTNGLGMGLATTAVLVVSNVLVAMIRHTVSSQVRTPVFVVLIATLVTVVNMAMNAWLHDLYKVLGLFIALIVVNCTILRRAEAFAVKSSVLAALVDGLAMGLGFTGALTVIGLIRELLGAGTLFAHASNLLGPSFPFLEQQIPDYGGALLMILPPGGFAVLGFLLAGKRVLENGLQPRARRVVGDAANVAV